MQPSVVRLSKASRIPLTPKHGNKDFYKGTRAAFLPGGPRTGAPGVHVVKGKAKYRIIDEKVRYFVAPPISLLNNTPLRPYVHTSTSLRPHEQKWVYGSLKNGKFTGQHYLDIVSKSQSLSQGIQSTTSPSEPQSASSPS